MTDRILTEEDIAEITHSVTQALQKITDEQESKPIPVGDIPCEHCNERIMTNSNFYIIHGHCWEAEIMKSCEKKLREAFKKE